MLDVCSGELNPLGYNHESFRPAVLGKGAAAFDATTINATAAEAVATAGFVNEAALTLNKVMPKGLQGFTLVS